ncbi:hypothetical protein ANN_16612 [Periplaneta americana]|uniref:Uncharacterized protein n=1 Tax=Periplaneta americana TaxID=6978 RepID=A0ABQ8SS01_PERAM|nr:hypothetical protein ANN_16612 [Periplaneta americana]
MTLQSRLGTLRLTSFRFCKGGAVRPTLRDAGGHPESNYDAFKRDKHHFIPLKFTEDLQQLSLTSHLQSLSTSEVQELKLHICTYFEGNGFTEDLQQLSLTSHLQSISTSEEQELKLLSCTYFEGNGEVETLAHVLGACPHGELLRNTRHHTVRSIIATALRNKGYSVHEEVHGISSEGSNRRIDIIAFKPPSLEGYIIDPTVRFESHEHQPEEVHEEKRNIYEPSVSFYKDKYHLEFIVITGLMIGVRTPVPSRLL